MYEANIDENVCAELKKVYFMWSEIQPEVMEPQKCEIKSYLSENAFIQQILLKTFYKFYEQQVFLRIRDTFFFCGHYNQKSLLKIR
jgi:hypothetical protein